MSFLNSVLSTIGGDDKQSHHVAQAQPQPKLDVQRVGANADSKPRSNVAQPTISSTGQKRKAEDSLPAPKTKASKGDQEQTQGSSATVSPGISATKQVQRPSITTSKAALAVPYRGTSRPSPKSASPDIPKNVPAKSGPPKKGSYAEIMARAASNNKPQVGVIKHKPKDAISAKKEIMMRKKGIIPNGRSVNKEARDGIFGRNSNSPVPPGATTKKSALPGNKPLPQPSYKGTAAPKPQPTYKGTMNMKSGSSIANTARRKDSRNDRSRSNSINPSRHSREYDSEEEEDEVDDEEDEFSDDSMCMEAGMSDVEKEETAATKAARKEDEEQLRIENELKKEKEDRKRRLAAMAAKAPKPKY
ncbi:MAG: hypothetical protein Q9209_005119 [Squamulea sp. 1 TL-2023]